MLLFIESLSADINTVTLVSIHLMLLFIPPESAQRSLSDYVSIHLMLLFIYLLVTINKIKVSFNTSHVTLYLMSAFPSQEVQFRFNTSHVTLYLLRIKFQHGCANSFQYISCYSLSSISFFVNTYNFSFNTSHVTLYRIEKRNLTRFIPCFNTSHVTLYRGVITIFSAAIPVSIHLMLLFISQRFQGQKWQSPFQYISCYSLSLVFPIFSLLTFFIISQNTRVCNIFPKQHRLFESFHRSTPKPYIFTTFHIFL